MEWHLGLPLLRAYKDCIEAARPDRTERATQGDRRSRCEAKVFEKPAEKRVQWSAWYLTAILATQASLLLAAGWHVYHQRGRSRGAGALEEKRTSPRKYDSGELVEQDVQKDSTDYLATAGNEYPIRSPLTQADGIAAGSCRNLNLQTELDVLCITIPALTHCYGSSTPSSSASESLSWHSCFSVADAEQIEGDTPSNKSVDERIDEVLKLSPKVDS